MKGQRSRKSDAQIEQATPAVISPVGEQALAQWRSSQGARVLCHAGRYWEEHPRGFFHALPWLARLSDAEATRPSAWCWGFRATVDEAAAPAANAAMHVHRLADASAYTMASLTPRRRNKLRRCHDRATVVELLDGELLRRDGHPVHVSAHARNGYGPLLDRRAYLRWVDSHFAPRCGLVIGGLVDGRLCGYVVSYAVGGTAYIDEVQLADEALRLNLGTALIFETLQAVRRSAGIVDVVFGQETPENAGLRQFKAGMGFPVEALPARVWFAPLTAAVVRRLRPNAYFRLTGRGPASNGA